jgi:hypothetical protein
MRFNAVPASVAALALILGGTTGVLGAAQSAYPRMAPLQQYLTPGGQAEVALARTAAPASLSAHATVLVLTRHGYQVAAKGSNGFTCLVERSWMKSFDDSEFWDWKMRAPTCFNPEAARTIVPYTIQRTNLALAGSTESEIFARIKAAVAAKQLPSPAPGAMSYMMSKQQDLTDAQGHWMPHLMWYAPKADTANDGANWGADLSGSPVLFDTAHRVNPEPWTLFFVPVSHWSDGSRAPQM